MLIPLMSSVTKVPVTMRIPGKIIFRGFKNVVSMLPTVGGQRAEVVISYLGEYAGSRGYLFSLKNFVNINGSVDIRLLLFTPSGAQFIYGSPPVFIVVPSETLIRLKDYPIDPAKDELTLGVYPTYFEITYMGCPVIKTTLPSSMIVDAFAVNMATFKPDGTLVPGVTVGDVEVVTEPDISPVISTFVVVSVVLSILGAFSRFL